MQEIRLSRRRFVAAGVAATGLATMKGIARGEAPCVLVAEQEQGPFYLDKFKVRKDISEDRTGIPLRIRLLVQDVKTCRPVSGAAVDLWHCDAMGLYSGFTKTAMGPGGPGGPPPWSGRSPQDGPPPDGPPLNGPPGNGRGGPPPQMKASDELTFLRGIQVTDQAGAVEFQTIFPGYYQGRTNHVHFKVRLAGERDGERYAGGHTSHTGQLFFPEDWNLKLMQRPEYAGHHIHRTTAAEDGVYTGQHGAGVVATVVARDAADPAKGLTAELTVAIDPAATPKLVGIGGPPGRRD